MRSSSSSAAATPRSLGFETRIVQATLEWRLTPRQREILWHLARGASNTAIARALGVSTGSVETHVGQILRKAGVDARAALAWKFWTLGASPTRASLAEAQVAWSLTSAQSRVLECLAHGVSNKEIMAELDCAKSTVEAHVTALLRKSGSSSRAELVMRYWSGAFTTPLSSSNDA